ncbi:hypothetical protein TNCV_3139931 [Trichonephila clavipes]|nr:hypothetical protein TNCV_3139931 [Trichonephila clavipes]
MLGIGEDNTEGAVNDSLNEYEVEKGTNCKSIMHHLVGSAYNAICSSSSLMMYSSTIVNYTHKDPVGLSKVTFNYFCDSHSLLKIHPRVLFPNDSMIFSPLEKGYFGCCQVIYSQFGWAIHQNDHQARSRFVDWAQNEIAVVPYFHKRILFSDEAHFWLNGYVNKQNCRIWSEANPQVYVETPLHPEKLTVWCALWAGGILLQKR